ncbi:MAG: molecular chaperone HtpG, partial [Candidatus Dormibacteria bacterium]
MESVDDVLQGTAVTLHLKPEDEEDHLFDYTVDWKIKEIVKRYSDFITWPIKMEVERTDKDGKITCEIETINSMKALWARSKNEVKEDEYRDLYKHISHDWNDPLEIIRMQAEGAFEYQALLFIPSQAPLDLFMRDRKRGVQLYVKRVFIMDDCEALMPEYLRFVKGVVDAGDLPLNISRELLQQEPQVEAIRAGLTRRVLDLLGRLAKDEPDKYATFWKEFGAVLKEGLAQDPASQPALLGLLRFASTASTDDTPAVSLAAYLARMKPGQERIYYVIAETLEAARASPAIERLKERGLEVLLLAERIDEWVMGQLEGFEGKRFKDAARGDVELGGLASAADRQRHDAELKESKGLLKRIKDALGERVTEVRVSERLKESPACLVLGEHDLGDRLRKILAAAGQKAPDARPLLEVN